MDSRQAVDDFLAYQATLPQSEQKAIDFLKALAKDRYTGQTFDTLIREVVHDVQGSRLYFHKTSDLIDLAAHHPQQR